MRTNDHSTTSPWGVALSEIPYEAGIVHIYTAKHEGFWISDERRAQMPEPLRSIEPRAGANWYECDDDAHIVALAFPEAFPAMTCWRAVRWARDAGLLSPRTAPGIAKYLSCGSANALSIAEKYEREHASDFFFGIRSYGPPHGLVVSGISVDGKTRFTARKPVRAADWMLPIPAPAEVIIEMFEKVEFKQSARSE